MGFIIVIGGAIGTIIGIYTFTYFKDIGKIDTVISLAYMYILAIIGTLMLVESLGEIDKARKNTIVKRKLHVHYWIHGLPFRMRFPKSKLYESAFTPIIIGLFVGFIAAIMGIGGAFILVPAMIYIIGMPTKLVPGTSLFVTIFITALVVIGHAIQFQTIDFVLVLTLIFGSIVGLHIGLKVSEKLNPSEYKTLLAILLLAVGIIMGLESFVLNESLFLSEIVDPKTNRLTEIVLNMSTNHPFVYGSISIMTVVLIGISFSYIREFIHYIRYDMDEKNYKFFK